MKYFLLISTLIVSLGLSAQYKSETMPLYQGGVPNAILTPNEEKTAIRNPNVTIVSKVSMPELIMYLPEKSKATGAAVVICPGGGYSVLAIKHEGYDIAEKLVENGIAAFVLKYRLPDPATSSAPFVAPLQDAQHAIAFVKQNAAKWNINADKVGIMGFSAGGHLASTAATHFDKIFAFIDTGKIVRPDFAALIYPVITTDKGLTHAGSIETLLKNNLSIEMMSRFSNEQRVTSKTPPSFLVHSIDDKAVPYKNSTLFAEALINHNVPVEIHLFPKGGHGYGLNNPTTDTKWFDLFVNWLKVLK